MERLPHALAPEVMRWAEAVATGPLCESVVRQFQYEALVCWSTWEVTPICTTRSAASILAGECGYTSMPGERMPRVGMWAGGAFPPAWVSIGANSREPHHVFSGRSLGVT